jgi:hypothetical protein
MRETPGPPSPELLETVRGRAPTGFNNNIMEYHVVIHLGLFYLRLKNFFPNRQEQRAIGIAKVMSNAQNIILLPLPSSLVYSGR